MARPKSDNPRLKKTSIRLSELEFTLLQSKANSANLSISEYLRNLGMNYPIQSRLEWKVVEELTRLRGDLGRLGGLYKLWIYKNEETKLNLGNRSFQSISELVDEMEEREKEIMHIARSLLREKV